MFSINFQKVVKTLAFAGAIFFAASFAARAGLMAGAGKEDITPDWPVYLGGYYNITQRNVGVHDPLHVRALVLDDGQTKLAIVEMDLVIMGGVMAGEIKDRIASEVGIPVENINISATHTHTGPEGYFEEFGKYPKEYSPKLKMLIEDQSVKAVKTAMERLRPASIGYKQFELPHYNRNRHDGEGPVDRRAVLAVVKDEQGKVFTGFLNFAAHPTVVAAEELLISAEWVGMFQSDIEAKIGGDDTVFLYLQGACGNLSPEADEGDGGWDRAMRYGERLANDVYPMIAELATSSDVALAAKRKDFTFKARTGASVRAFAKSIPEKTAEIQARTDITDNRKNDMIGWLKERMGIENFMQTMIKTMDRVEKGQTKTMTEAMRIGDLLLLAYPGEPVTELSMEIREKLAPAPVAVLGYSNDHLGYITTRKIYYEGGYEAGMGLVYPPATEEMTAWLIEAGGELWKK